MCYVVSIYVYGDCELDFIWNNNQLCIASGAASNLIWLVSYQVFVKMV